MTKNPISNGFIYLIHGFTYLKTPGIKRFLIIPLFINLLLLSIFLSISIHFFKNFNHWLVSDLPHWLDWLTWITWVLFTISYLLVSAYTFTIIANLIAAPFNNLLAEKIEELVGKQKLVGTGWLDIAKDLPRTLNREWQKIKYYLPRLFLMLILFLTPGVNAVAGVVWLLFSSWMMAVQYIDYPFDNHKIPFWQTLKYLRKNSLRNLSFGFAVTLANFIPIINLAVMPAAVVGATLMWLEDNSAKQFRDLVAD